MPERIIRYFLQQQLALTPVRGLVVGLSGGLDSCVLLHALRRADLGLPVRALHVHHGLSPHADSWTEQVQRFCAKEGVPLAVYRVQVRHEASLEGAARTARYGAFTANLQPHEALLLAQHRDDQAETFLFRLLRGAGVTGLGAMRPCRTLRLADGAEIPQWRPLLAVTRAELLAYAQKEGLSWVEDESNEDRRYARNFLRHEILPRLHEHWPAASATLAATAVRLQEADDLLQELAAEMAHSCIDSEQRLLLPAFLSLSPPRQRLLLRYWLRQQGFLLPDERVLEAILSDVVAAREDANPQLSWPGCEIRRYRDRLYAMPPLSEMPQGWEVEWRAGAPLTLPDGSLLIAEDDAARAGTWRVRYRRGGERLRPAPERPSRELKTLLQEAGVPPWQRDRLPLVFDGDVLIAVAGLTLPGAGSRWRFTLHPPPSA